MIDKGLGLVLGGFVPNTFEQVVEYTPNINEVLVILGVYGIGFLVLTVLCKVAVGVRAKEIAPAREHGADGDAAAAACEEPAAS